MSSSSDQPSSSSSSPPPSKSQPLALPSTSDARDNGSNTTTINSGTTVSMDAMGPVVVNVDGTMSRINNWGEMSEIEKQNTLRILGKRNRERRAALLAKEKAETGGQESRGLGSTRKSPGIDVTIKGWTLCSVG
ncbi:hypothetical protein SODALDRAFT_333510 [Sodiomyces alkalinus F11]|uniref:Uncharacterized protein n=1 Tax=Sodiomyces alkalinus (strain CBS 110278 / VKM F-3762 / F11) TaxID=1314773 RepID=A0A3N2PTJ5_SODAK|nr:hypothetical protein SODALDRAFT_333510 [Sodiomyces alkalinus F11]ROT37754.1 hypothetical protein SODALDRAFT_333510 [Sodiomyces alkalinus F11]